jgi:hypothetical protein
MRNTNRNFNVVNHCIFLHELNSNILSHVMNSFEHVLQNGILSMNGATVGQYQSKLMLSKFIQRIPINISSLVLSLRYFSALKKSLVFSKSRIVCSVSSQESILAVCPEILEIVITFLLGAHIAQCVRPATRLFSAHDLYSVSADDANWLES